MRDKNVTKAKPPGGNSRYKLKVDRGKKSPDQLKPATYEDLGVDN
jgi:hypothetical protein